MKTTWDYSSLARPYLKRPGYASSAIDQMLALAGVQSGDPVCDIGARVAHLTLELQRRGLKVTAVEPNDSMRELGQQRTGPDVAWHEAVAEDTGLPEKSFRLVTFGSSFNVTDRQRALQETARLLQPAGWFACMWNHRDLADPIQAQIEAIIQEALQDYHYGSRREDQSEVIAQSSLFRPVNFLEGTIHHRMQIPDVVEAWRSHATLERQAGPKFSAIVARIETLLQSLDQESIEIPYTTRLWCAQLET